MESVSANSTCSIKDDTRIENNTPEVKRWLRVLSRFPREGRLRAHGLTDGRLRLYVKLHEAEINLF